MRFAMIRDIKLSNTWKTFVSVFQKLVDFIVRYQALYIFPNNHTLDPPRMFYSVLPPPLSRTTSDAFFRNNSSSAGLLSETFHILFLSFLVGTLMSLVKCMKKAGILIQRSHLELEDTLSYRDSIPYCGLGQKADSDFSKVISIDFYNSESGYVESIMLADRLEPDYDSDYDPELDSATEFETNIKDFLLVSETNNSTSTSSITTIAPMFNTQKKPLPTDVFDIGHLSMRFNSIRSLGISGTTTNNKTAKPSDILIW
ncbi:uncharacterized protein Ecym_2657 [Eremothecium cymbalariae DBVPG|uniref:Uncharacterized protein n=1 Tax=Eremothecium cymbalariae (strain CBS 270.75 / DBVPG 7215 / KCTC 17166 / NRRL Y-17582) TaxID=931890 RepID=G8JNU3_ERECY|nr:Hypothetical protein Ecym_2657 [Eremothecium cymbalariae DBVPG\